MELKEFAQYCVNVLRHGEMSEHSDEVEQTFEQLIQFGNAGQGVPEGSKLYCFFRLSMEFKKVSFSPSDVMREMLTILAKNDPVFFNEVDKSFKFTSFE